MGTDFNKAKSFGNTKCGNTEFRWGERTYVMGICNLSPDSFSGDGLGGDVETAVQQARRFVSEGADIIDIGGESTRPGTKPLSKEDVENELRLVIPVIERLASELTVPLSIDTYKSVVAKRALKAGVSMINDIWGLKKDPALGGIAAEAGVPIILMSNQRETPCEDIMPEIISTLKESINLALNAGIPCENIIIDPGVGFGKTVAQNLEIIDRLGELKSLGRPILLGTSRKSTIGAVLDLPVDQRLHGTSATVAIGIARGVDIVRVHDVQPMVQVCRMSDAIIRRKA